MPKHTITLIALILSAATGMAANVFPYRSFEPVQTTPSENVNCIFFDSDGLLWAGTNFGLKMYDGYAFKTYRSDTNTPGILPNNTVRSITSDHDGGLWIGTLNGLVRMDKRTGQFRTFSLGGKDQQIIYTLYTSRDGTVWIGTDGGLSYYDPARNAFHTYDSGNSWSTYGTDGKRQRTGRYSVKAILEDTNGDIIVGTWSSGLMRLRRGSDTFWMYPRLNEQNSAYSLFIDSRQRLWVGTWGYGILRIDNPRDLSNLRIHQYPYTTGTFDIFFKIIEDRNTGKLWACSREGICSLDQRTPSAQWQQYNRIGDTPLNYCNDMARDPNGNLWVSTQNQGIIQTTFRPTPFRQWRIGGLPNGMPVSYVWALLTTDGNTFYLGFNPYGIARYDRSTGTTLCNRSIPGFDALPPASLTTSVTSIFARSNGEKWFATNGYGVIIHHEGQPARLLTTQNAPFLWEDFINEVAETPDKTMWIGTRSGLSVMFPNGSGRKIVILDRQRNATKCDIRKVSPGKDGTVWLATNNEGIIRLTGDTRKPGSLRARTYSQRNGKYSVLDATACLHDRHGRLWAISNSGGLFLYNAEEDRFEAKNHEYHIPGNRILAINEDLTGCLWLTTDNALIRMNLPVATNKPDVMLFTKEDGLNDMLFATNSTSRHGTEMYFGNRAGFFSFHPAQTPRLTDKNAPYKLIVTNVTADDTPITTLDSTRRAKVADMMPPYTRKLTIPAYVKTLKIDFSLLSYGNASKNMYAYKFGGYDDQWHYTGNIHAATFQNLPPGHYQLQIKGMDGNGRWQEMPYKLKIRMLPPWYASWWAYVIYTLLAAGAIVAGTVWYRERLRTLNRLRMGMTLTNITHELLTPLTVVSATVFKLRGMSPQHSDEYQVIDNNISRTTRLLRQILEVRKSQAGQLRLKVSRNDMAAFVRNEVEAIRPMAEGRKLTLSLSAPDKETNGWFDTDKLDKILYNLISNAIKYNHEDGSVTVSLATNKDKATIKVLDTGIGMSRQQLKHLYTRFFDGDYRRQRLKGTGIGLALVHELVKLHHGRIDCQSKEGEGTTFTVTLPMRKNAYAKDEIDTSTVNSAVDRDTIRQLAAGDSGDERIRQQTVLVKTNAPAVLIVEDNDDLLELMRQTLSKHYHTFTAKNGKQAWNVIQKENLDLVITDVMMPVMDGIELLRAIKNDKGFWQLPVMLLTAKSKDDDKKTGYAKGADAYMVKPFNFDELVIRADALIANHRKIMMKYAPEDAEPESNDKMAHASNPEQVFLDKATECVHRHIDDTDFDREAFAHDMLVSSSTLYNKVRALTGKTIVEFINDIRLEEAHRILKQEPGITITELASRVGFNTPKYFSRLYRKKYKEEKDDMQ